MTNNPYNPLRPTADPTLFYGRQDAIAFLTLHLSGRMLDKAMVILGQHGMGKSSLLAQVPVVIDERYTSVKIDAAALELDDMVAFIATIVDQTRAMMNAIQASTYRLPPFPDPTDPDVDLLAWLADDYLEVVFSAIWRSRRLVMMVDNADLVLDAIEAGNFPADFMAYWQALLQRFEQLNLLFTINIINENRVLTTPPMDDPALHYRLTNLSIEEAQQVVIEPVQMLYGFADDALERIIELAGGHPLHLHSMGHLIHRRWEQDRNRINIVSLQDVNAVFPAALELARDTIGSIWTHLTNNERLVLTSLLDMHEPATAEVIGEWLHGTDFPLDKVQIAAALRGLDYYGILTTTDDGAYDFASQLQAEWLRRHYQLGTSNSNAILRGGSNTWLYITGFVLIVVVIGFALLTLGGNDNSSTNAPLAGSTITLENEQQRTQQFQATQRALPTPTATASPLPVFRIGG